MAHGELINAQWEVSSKGQIPSLEGQGPKKTFSAIMVQISSSSRVKAYARETNICQQLHIQDRTISKGLKKLCPKPLGNISPQEESLKFLMHSNQI